MRFEIITLIVQRTIHYRESSFTPACTNLCVGLFFFFEEGRVEFFSLMYWSHCFSNSDFMSLGFTMSVSHTLHTVRWWEVDEHSALNLLQEA